MSEIPKLKLGKAMGEEGRRNSTNEELTDMRSGQRATTPQSVASEKRRARGEYKIHDREEDDEERAKTREEEEIYLRDINLREKTDDRMVFRKVPFALWIVGTLILITAIYLLYTLALGYFGVLYKGPKQG